MKISVDWLKQFVEIPEKHDALGDRLTSVGLAVESAETIGNDTVFELDVTTNRPDCLNHLGVAREASAIYGTALRKPEFSVKESVAHTEDAISVSISAPELCGRYCARYLSGVKIGPAPDWLKARLEEVGVRSINNVADVTNYVMLELGQPLHAFDADTLGGQQIIVRRAEINEKLTTLDGVERELNPSILVIADATRPIALAGIMGGSDTEISGKTVNVLLESAYFNPLAIRKAARSLNMNTEASYRFERGADVEMSRYACDRAAALIQELAGGNVSSGVIDVYPGKRPQPAVRLRRQRIASFLGAPVEDSVVERIFNRLEFAAEPAADGWTLLPPTFRVDISTEQDLLEEIARHYGFDKFQPTLPVWRGYGSPLPGESEERLLRSVLMGAGYTEVYTYSFSDEGNEQGFIHGVDPVRIMNPMSEDAAILRRTLAPGIIRSIQWNLNRGIRDVQFYELSKVYARDSERRALILASTGGVRDFYDLKGDIETLLETFNCQFEISATNLPQHYHPGRAARFGNDIVFGELHPQLADSLKIRQRVYIAEAPGDLFLNGPLRRQIKPIPRFPSVRRDFSLLLDKGTQYGEVQKTIASAGIAEVVSVEPFDRLEAGPFPETKYSLAISVIYQSPDRTLTDAEVEKFDSKILELLLQRLNAQLRK
jgi:phenylalanyl-tRNA synthetase beta chain